MVRKTTEEITQGAPAGRLREKIPRTYPKTPEGVGGVSFAGPGFGVVGQ